MWMFRRTTVFCWRSIKNASAPDLPGEIWLIGDTKSTISRHISMRGRTCWRRTVWNLGTLAPVAQISNRTGFLLRGEGEIEQAANTNDSWWSEEEPGFQAAAVSMSELQGYYAADPIEKIDARLFRLDVGRRDEQSTTMEESRIYRACRRARNGRYAKQLAIGSRSAACDGMAGDAGRPSREILRANYHGRISRRAC